MPRSPRRTVKRAITPPGHRFGSAPATRTPKRCAIATTSCPGTKIGGRPAIERKGQRFDHLVTFSSYEFDRCGFRRWLAIEDQRLLAPPGQPLTEPQLHAGLNTHPLIHPAGMELGRSQRAHLYLCRDRLPWEAWGYIGD